MNKKLAAILLAAVALACPARSEDAPSIESVANLAPQKHYAAMARKVSNMLPA